MGKPTKDFLQPEHETTFAEKLTRIALRFRSSLEKIRAHAATGDDDSNEFAAEGIQLGSPKKHVVAAAFALSVDEMARLFGRVRWRSSMSESKEVADGKVRSILNAIDPEAEKTRDMRIIEFMHDFSASNYAVTELIGQVEGYPAKHNPVFKMWLVAESETGGSSPRQRQKLVYRDMVKLCLVETEVRVLVYRGYDEEEAGERHAMLDGALRTIRRITPAPAPLQGWLFIGLLGNWPHSQTMYFHTISDAGDMVSLKV